jgi:hypothetical protein
LLQALVPLGEQDAAVLAAVGGYDDRLYKKVAEDLLTLRINQQPLLAGGGERLDVPQGMAHPHAEWFAENLHQYRTGQSAGGLARPAAPGGWSWAPGRRRRGRRAARACWAWRSRRPSR